MKKMLQLSLTTALALSLFSTPAALACEDPSEAKALLLPGEDFPDNIPLITRGKNLSNLKEVASVPLQDPKGIKTTGADVYAHKGFAYMGTHVGAKSNEGVRVFDLSDPANPVEVAVFANDIPGTWQEKVIVKSVSTPHFKGDLAVVSVQKFSHSDPQSGGTLVYDVTDPKNPKKLGFWAAPQEVKGTHELYMTEQGNRVLLLTANSFASSRTQERFHDLAIVDITDPTNPTTLSNWDPHELMPENNYSGQWYEDENGVTRTGYAHSVRTDETGKYAYVSYWDLGTVILDISDPAQPKTLSHTTFERHVQGYAHSSALAHGGNILIETREMFEPDPFWDDEFERGWGYVRIYDIKDKTNPKLISTFRTTNSMTQIKKEERKPGVYAVHDPKVRGNTLYLSHYSDGLRMVDITDPYHPTEIASYVPSAANIWGVFIDRNYILASDMGTGLKVLQNNAAGGQQ